MIPASELLKAEEMSKNHHVRLSILLFCLVSAPLNSALVAKADEPKSIHFHESYNAAMQEAKLTQKPIFLEFRCAP